MRENGWLVSKETQEFPYIHREGIEKKIAKSIKYLMNNIEQYTPKTLILSGKEKAGKKTVLDKIDEIYYPENSKALDFRLLNEKFEENPEESKKKEAVKTTIDLGVSVTAIFSPQLAAIAKVLSVFVKFYANLFSKNEIKINTVGDILEHLNELIDVISKEKILFILYYPEENIENHKKIQKIIEKSYNTNTGAHFVIVMDSFDFEYFTQGLNNSYYLQEKFEPYFSKKDFMDTFQKLNLPEDFAKKLYEFSGSNIILIKIIWELLQNQSEGGNSLYYDKSLKVWVLEGDIYVLFGRIYGFLQEYIGCRIGEEEENHKDVITKTLNLCSAMGKKFVPVFATQAYYESCQEIKSKKYDDFEDIFTDFLEYEDEKNCPIIAEKKEVKENKFVYTFENTVLYHFARHDLCEEVEKNEILKNSLLFLLQLVKNKNSESPIFESFLINIYEVLQDHESIHCLKEKQRKRKLLISLPQKIKQAKTGKEEFFLLNLYADLLKENGNYQNALANKRKAKKLIGSLPEGFISYADFYHELSWLYHLNGKNDSALEFGLKSVAIFEKVLDKNHPNLATSYNNLSMIYLNLGNSKKALEFDLRALAIREKVLDENHPALAVSYSNLALVYKDLGNLEKGLEFALKAVEIRGKVLDKNHPDLASSYNDLAYIYVDRGEYEVAKEYIERAIKILEFNFPQGHPNLDSTYNGLKMIDEQIQNSKK